MLLNQEKPTRILVELEIVSGFHRYSINTHTDTQTLTHLLLLFQSPGHIKEFCLKNTSFPRNNWPQYLGNGPQFSSGVKSDFTQRSEHSALPSSSLVAQTVKNLPELQEMWVQSLGQEDPPEKEKATHSSILPGESHGQRSLVGYRPRGQRELDTTEWLTHRTLSPSQLCHRLSFLGE